MVAAFSTTKPTFHDAWKPGAAKQAQKGVMLYRNASLRAHVLDFGCPIVRAHFRIQGRWYLARCSPKRGDEADYRLTSPEVRRERQVGPKDAQVKINEIKEEGRWHLHDQRRAFLHRLSLGDLIPQNLAWHRSHHAGSNLLETQSLLIPSGLLQYQLPLLT